MKITLSILLTLLLFSCAGQSREDVNRRIASSDKLQRIDQFCTALEKPDDFSFVFKRISGNSVSQMISYRFRSKKTFSEVRKFYDDVFAVRGWELLEIFEEDPVRGGVGVVEFKNDRFVVSVSHTVFEASDYAIDCIESYAK